MAPIYPGDGVRASRGARGRRLGGSAGWSSSGREGRHGRAVILLWDLRTRPQVRSLAARETCSVAGAPRSPATAKVRGSRRLAKREPK